MSHAFDLIVLGAGSAGLTVARRSAKLGARVALFDPDALGGTCVNRGCVPKKAMWFAAQWAQAQRLAADIGFAVTPAPLDWARFRRQRDDYIAGIRQRYTQRLDEEGIHVQPSAARFVAANTLLDADGARYSAPQIVIATGARPRRLDIPGFELGMVSDDIFILEAAPRHIAVVGGGYVATEFACVMHGLGCQVDLLVRGGLLSSFDDALVEALATQMQARGMRIVRDVEVVAAQGTPGDIRLRDASGASHGPYDAVLWAVGRTPNTDGLGLDAVEVALDTKGHVQTDAFQNTSVPGITAIGDVTGRHALTPVAVAAGHALAQRLFGGEPQAHFDYEAIPSVVFAEPPLGGVGLTEREARERHGDAVRIHAGSYTPLQLMVAGHHEQSMVKLVCVGEDERVLGIHALGPGSEELLQGFAVALRMGLHRRDLKASVAIHPTAAEEVVLLR
ncbi:glutathione-disulfide reductase [Rhodanobacter glycinis]|uniref:NADPH-glutathione reductase n=1 Tax=Rhodanobacter glycinis TaxID=582702 RepID=A0A1I4CAV4_9GAMM|nr:glutathione-disulfide reductase [Rhodanobacter glycinis]SFK77923.1 NADPH-glutathione reductase [Rhodanobacter glycinis]